jgi:hypothetical protein
LGRGGNKNTLVKELTLAGFIFEDTMLRLSLIALVAALAKATTPDNVSSRLMIHVSSIQKREARKMRTRFLSAVEFLRSSTRIPTHDNGACSCASGMPRDQPKLLGVCLNTTKMTCK